MTAPVAPRGRNGHPRRWRYPIRPAPWSAPCASPRSDHASVGRAAELDPGGRHSWPQPLEHLFDRRRQTPSPKRAPVAEVQRVLAVYPDRYQGFNVRHFHQLARRQPGVRFCYAFVKKALQSAGLVAKHRPRGRHRRRREPRPCFGELLHLDGSRHRWLALPDQWFTLIAVVDDATVAAGSRINNRALIAIGAVLVGERPRMRADIPTERWLPEGLDSP